MKKRILTIILAALMVVSLLPVTVFAETVELPADATWMVNSGENHVWYKLESGVLTIGGEGAMPIYDDSSNYSPFYNNATITSCTIQSGVTRIGSYAFYKCTGLKSITIPSSVTGISGYAFSDVSSMEELHIESVESWCKLSLISSSCHPLNANESGGKLYVGDKEVTALVIPNTVSKIGGYAFCNCTNLKSITIPSSVTTINKGAFMYASNIEELHIESVESWCNVTMKIKDCHPLNANASGGKLYVGDKEVTALVIPNAVTIIPIYAFYKCTGLTSVTIPAGVTSIKANVFNGCTNLTTVTVKATTNPTLGSTSFENCDKIEKIYVPAESLDAYKKADYWSTYAGKMVGAYDVSVAAATNGTVTVDRDIVAEGETVTVTVAPADGYQLKSLKYNDGTDHDITATKSFAMPDKAVTVTAEFEEKTSYDVVITGEITVADFAYEIVIPTATSLDEDSHENVLLGKDGIVSVNITKHPSDKVNISYTVNLDNGTLTDGTNTIDTSYAYKQDDGDFTALTGETKVTVYTGGEVVPSYVNVTADDDQWNDAPAGTYTASISFNFYCEPVED